MEKKSSTFSADSDDFWHEDAVAAAERERVDETGLRMPAASEVVVNDGSGVDSVALTQRQIAFALCLGIDFKADDSAESISKRIDHTKARAEGYRVNQLQQRLAVDVHSDIEDCETRSEAAWILWDDYEEDPEQFFRSISVEFQRQNCGGLFSRFGVAGPVNRGPAAVRLAGSLITCSCCLRLVSSSAIRCPECNGEIHGTERSVSLATVLAVSVVVAAVLIAFMRMTFG